MTIYSVVRAHQLNAITLYQQEAKGNYVSCLQQYLITHGKAELAEEALDRAYYLDSGEEEACRNWAASLAALGNAKEDLLDAERILLHSGLQLPEPDL